MKTTLLLSLALMLACGCASVGNNFDSRKISEIKKGETTEPELVQMFGQPQQRGVNSEQGTTLTWLYTEARVKGESFIPFAGPFVGGTTSKTKTLTVRLDPQGKVAGYDYTGGGLDENTGSIQPDPENDDGAKEGARQAVSSPKG